jgi:hypothetical protein
MRAVQVLPRCVVVGGEERLVLFAHLLAVVTMLALVRLGVGSWGQRRARVVVVRLPLLRWGEDLDCCSGSEGKLDFRLMGDASGGGVTRLVMEGSPHVTPL